MRYLLRSGRWRASDSAGARLCRGDAWRDLMLMPVPRSVIDEIAGRPLNERLHW